MPSGDKRDLTYRELIRLGDLVPRFSTRGYLYPRVFIIPVSFILRARKKHAGSSAARCFGVNIETPTDTTLRKDDTTKQGTWPPYCKPGCRIRLLSGSPSIKTPENRNSQIKMIFKKFHIATNGKPSRGSVFHGVLDVKLLSGHETESDEKEFLSPGRMT